MYVLRIFMYEAKIRLHENLTSKIFYMYLWKYHNLWYTYYIQCTLGWVWCHWVNEKWRHCIRSIRCRGYYLFHHLSLCGIYLRAVFITIPVATREAIRRETCRWCHWTWSPSADVEAERVVRHVHVLRASPILGVAWLLFESGDYFVQHSWRCGDFSRAATNRERRLIEWIQYV